MPPNTQHKPPAKPQPPSREDVAKLEIGHTTVSRRTAIGITIGFLGIILAVPIIQLCIGLTQKARTGASPAWDKARAAGSSWPPISTCPSPMRARARRARGARSPEAPTEPCARMRG